MDETQIQKCFFSTNPHKKKGLSPHYLDIYLNKSSSIENFNSFLISSLFLQGCKLFDLVLIHVDNILEMPTWSDHGCVLGHRLKNHQYCMLALINWEFFAICSFLNETIPNLTPNLHLNDITLLLVHSCWSNFILQQSIKATAFYGI
jgi:hypothetical protein